MNLEDGLTRREFLRAISVGAADSLITLRKGSLSYMLGKYPYSISTYQKITFKQALADRANRNGVRQKYLEQLVSESPYSQYMGYIVYDHDFSQAIRASTDLSRIWNNPRILMEYLNEYLFLNDPSFHNLDANGRSERRNNFLRSNQNKEAFSSYLERKNKLLVIFIKTRNAIILSPSFGIKGKSTLYVFDDNFETVTLYSAKGPIVVQPSESRILAILAHEFVHAEDNFKGITNINPPITSENYLDVHSEVFGFVKEIRGYLSGIEKATQLEAPNKGYLLTNDFAKLPPAYFLAIQALRLYIAEKEKVLIPSNLSFQERMYVISQLNDIKRRASEMIIQSDVARFYRNFGVN